MSDELHKLKRVSESLDERFAKRPHTYNRLYEIADMIDETIAQGATADEAEARAIEQIDRLGREMLTDWAEEKHRKSLEQARVYSPSSSLRFLGVVHTC